MILTTITHHEGDIFDSGADVLVNPVNCVGISGAGLAKQFKDKYPLTGLFYDKLCWYSKLRMGQPQMGDVHVKEQSVGTASKIVYFPTKKHWRDLSEMVDISRGLSSLVNSLALMIGRGEELRSIAIPALGCGLGELKWQDVKPEIVHVFESSGLPIHVMIYGPHKEG